MIELLNELRVALPGVQILFGFLLTVPFQQRFGHATPFQRDVYFVTLMLVAAASVLLIAPSNEHRLLFRRHYTERMLVTVNRIVIGGLGVLALALVSAVLLIADVLFGLVAGVLSGTGTGALLIWYWYALPLTRRESATSALDLT